MVPFAECFVDEIRPISSIMRGVKCPLREKEGERGFIILPEPLRLYNRYSRIHSHIVIPCTNVFNFHSLLPFCIISCLFAFSIHLVPVLLSEVHIKADYPHDNYSIAVKTHSLIVV